jgi:hypothetical protein
LKDSPGLLRASALKWRLEAGLGLIAVDEAKQHIRDLIELDPADTYLHVQAAAVLGRKENPRNTIPALRALAQIFDDAYVHQTLAGPLVCDWATWPEAWHEYKLAMRDGPLLGSRVRLAAYQLAKYLEPSETIATLSGSSAVERMVVRTRAMGLPKLTLFFVLGTFASLVVFLADTTSIGAASFIVATLLALWVSYSNMYVGCWKCTLVWLMLPGVAWALFAWAAVNPFERATVGEALLIFTIGLAFPAVREVIRIRRKLRAFAR